MDTEPLGNYILGIDLGSSSLGWALIERRDGKLGFPQTEGHPPVGARHFESATEGDRESGNEETKNVERRGARQGRRQTLRRARRKRNIFGLLQSFQLLPPGNSVDPVERQRILNQLDSEILRSKWFVDKHPVCAIPKGRRTPEQRSEVHRLSQLLPYILRAAALEEKLDPYLFGRALYHLGQRRGFLSNTKAAPKKDEKVGLVKEGISRLLGAMQSKDARTLGEYFARYASPSQERVRGPGQWTSRKEMYEPEFDQIWQTQTTRLGEVPTRERYEKLHKQLRHAFFDQRSTWFDPNTIGRCELEPDQRRAPVYLLISQRFRLLQMVNNLRVLPPGKPEYELSPGDRQKLIAELEARGDRSFDQIRTLLGLEKEYTFNLEPRKRKRKKSKKATGEEDNDNQKSGSAQLKGNSTNARFYKVFGQRWLGMSPPERDAAVEYAYAFENPDKRGNAAKRRWGLSDKAAGDLSEISFEPRPAGFSRKAMEKMLPLLEAGKTVEEARRQLDQKFEPHTPLKFLPPVQFASDPALLRKWVEGTKALPTGARLPEPIGEIRNPAVTRSLTELRKVVNDLIRKHGRPSEIHIELLRELKNPKKARDRIHEANLENWAARQSAKKQIKDANGDPDPSDEDIKKVLLSKECKEHCVYCGHPIAGCNRYGGGSDVHVDHIIPRSLCPDNTFTNLALCHSHCNDKKGARTPYQAFKGERWTEVESYARQYWGKTTRKKLNRFLMKDEELKKFLDKFSERQFRDSAYASKLAAKYLGYLYGGVYDVERRQRIICTSGEATAELRKAWKLFQVLRDGPTSNGGTLKKNRDDHRHHSVDAVAVALTSQGSIQDLTKAKWGIYPGSRRAAALLEEPWPNFVTSVRAEVDKIVVSHRVSKKVSGALHEDTNYSPKEFGKNVRRHRVPLTKLSEKDVMSEDVIPDKRVREIVRAKLIALGGGKPKDLFNSPKNLPCFEVDGGGKIPIKKVRIQKTIKTRQVGKEYRARFVKPGKNHHLEIYALLDPKDPERELGWESEDVVTMLDAFQRLRAKERKPVVKTSGFGDGTKFKFSITPGEVLECDLERKGKRLLSSNVKLTTEEESKGRVRLVVRGISQEEKSGSIKIEMAHLNDARPNIKFPDWVTKSPNELFKWNARKLVVSPLGEVSEAHD